MKKSLWMMVFVAFWLVGCIPSLHPIYTEEDLIFVPELLGTWSEEGSDETWSFSSEDPRSYDLVQTDDEGKKGEFSAHLFRIEGTMFLDLFPEEREEETSGFYKIHLLPVHTFILVEQIEPNLKMSFMDGEWLESYLEEHPGSLRHEIVEDGGIVLTASTKELQAFLVEHVKTEDAFGASSELTRQ